MKDAIIKKLRDVLGQVDSECKVVYILCESRKLLETYPPDPMPFAFKLYCHWALHIDLDHRKTTLPFLQRVDAFAASFLESNGNPAEEHQMLLEFIFLHSFRQQFRQFLESLGLPTTICEEDPRWHQFLKHYAGVIEDGSISCKAKPGDLKIVSEVIFRKGRPTESENNHLPFGLSWSIVLLDGRTLTVEVEAAPALPGAPQAINYRLYVPKVVAKQA
jgi:hypothetical protein